MLRPFLLCIPFFFGQTGPTAPVERGTATVCPSVSSSITDPTACPPPVGCRSSLCDCPVVWLRPWKCEDLEMKPFEPKPKFVGCSPCQTWLKNFLWCVPEEKKDENGKDDKKENGNGKNDKKNGDKKEADAKDEKKNGDEKKDDEKKDEEKKEETLTPIMQLIQCCDPCCYGRMKKHGDNVYGWLQMGYTLNPASPHDRINYGANFNWRSNDFRMNQLYLVFENTLEQEDKCNIGYRVDFVTGHDTPFLVSNGLFSDFTGHDATSGFGVEGPASFRQMNRVGIDLPQFYVEAHLPGLLTQKGTDIRLGKFYTLMGREVYPGKDTDFYSRTFENIVGTAYTHTGILATMHATDTLDLITGIVRGWDVFEDNNDRPSYHNAIIWNSCDKRMNWTTTFTTGPEQFSNNDNYRTVITSYLTVTWGCRSEWRMATGGLYGFEAKAATDATTGQPADAEWYDYSVHLFYTVDPRLILGFRGEWFHDDDGTRTAFFKRPGFAASFYDVTFGCTYKPYQNLRLRPELRFDWCPDARPYNDQRDRWQTTAAIDLIWEF